MPALVLIPLILFVIAIIAVIAIVVWGIKKYNQLVHQEENIENAMSQIGVQTESRWDALSNMIGATKQYSEHEAQTLESVMQARNGIDKNASVNDVREDDQMFNQAMKAIDVVVERYPELKASNLYQKTMDSVNMYEKDVKSSRMVFNDTVTKYNRLIKTFPTNFIASMFGHSERDYFQPSETKQDMPSWN